MFGNLKYLIIILSIFSLVTCKSKNIDRINLEKTSFNQLISWENDKHNDALLSFKNSCKKFNSSNKKKFLSNKFREAGKISDWINICETANGKNLDAKIFFENNFIPYLVKDKNETKGLFTGYYEIDLNGSYTKNDKYKFPLYKNPAYLNIPKNYLERKHINNGFLEGRDLEILYIDNHIDSFFLHIQGSGIVNLDNGDKVRVGYASQNGHPYYSIGKYFIHELKIDKAKINANFIRDYLAEYPDKSHSIMNLNSSYIFFKLNENDGPVGSLGSVLMPERSIAIDKNFIPLGIPIWLDTTYPDEEKTFRKLVIAQDTGGAIKGIIRGDIFFGNGANARENASNMKQQGSYYLLLPKL